MTELDDRPTTRSRPRRTALWLIVAAVLAVAIVIGLAAFQPWKIFTRSTVDEAAPVAVAATTAPERAAASSAVAAAPSSATPSSARAAGDTVPAEPADSGTAGSASAAGPATTGAATAEPSPPAEPAVLASGAFVDGEHETAGTARLLQLPDGSRFVRLEGFSTSDGPDVHVWVTDQQAGGGDWGKYDDGRYVELGTLKGTDGNQNYAVPSDADLQGLASVVIWCDRFNVAFGSAAIDP